MAQFELDDSIFEGSGESIVRHRLERHGRFFTFKISGTSSVPFELIGYIIYSVPAGTQREKNRRTI